jgi:DNA-binding MarR family transcriptional regulator
MQDHLLEIERKILEELHTDIDRARKGHQGVFRLDVLVNTLRVTMHLPSEEIEGAVNNLRNAGLIRRDTDSEGHNVLSLTDEGHRVLRSF